MLDLNLLKISLKDALKIAKEGETILLENKTYNEKIEVDKKNITLIGDELTKISYNAHSGMVIPYDLGGDGKETFRTTTSATVRIKEGADGFKAFGITFENSFKREENTECQAVAFKSEINDLAIENCKFIGEQDTLYIDAGKNNKISSSYIEGDIDFIFGSADCVFYNCKFHTVDTNKLAYFIAPSTIITNNYGFIFYKCEFYTDFKCDLGRGWFPSKATSPVYPKTSIIDSKLIGDINPNLVLMHQVDLGKKYSLKINNSYLNDNLLGNDNVEEELKYIKELF